MDQFIKYYFLLFLIMPFCMYAQNDTVNYKVESAVSLGSGDYSPFWLVNNRNGISSTLSNNAYLRIGADKKINRNSKFSYGFGLDLVGAYNFVSPFYVHQAYGEVKYRCLQMMVGAKELGNELKNKELSTGGLTESGNARPIPQIRIGIQEFTPIPYTKQWVHIKTNAAFGLFTDGRFQKDRYLNLGRHNLSYELDQAFGPFRGYYSENVWYHYKSLFLQFKKNKPLSLILGLEMGCQFGGTSYYQGYTLENKVGLNDLFNALVPHGGGYNPDTQISESVYGSNCGSYHIVLDYEKPEYKLRGYFENFFDDHSGMIFMNFPDGLWGLELNLKKQTWLSSVLVEYYHSMSQSGPFLYDQNKTIPIQVSGGDDYYNNFQYGGWVHHGMNIGTPLCTSPIYNKDGFLALRSNRVKSIHLAAMGTIAAQLDYRVKATYMQGWGTPFVPFIDVKNNASMFAEFVYKPTKLQGWNFSVAGAFDTGTLLGDNLGVQISVRKQGCLFKMKRYFR